MKKTLGILFFWLVDVPLCLLAAFLVAWLVDVPLCLLAAFLVVWAGIELISNGFCIFR